MKLELPEIRPEERTPLVEALLGIIAQREASLRQLLDRVAELEKTLQEVRDDNARLKQQKTRPVIQPSTLEQPPKNAERGKGRRRGKPSGPRNDRIPIHHTQAVLLEQVPEGAHLLHFESIIVQELVMESRNTEYWRARYALPEGGTVLAPLPAGVLPVEGGHFGTTLVSHILNQYYGAGVTQPALMDELLDRGIVISEGQLSKILTEGKDRFHQEKEEVRAAGLTEASYIGADDTGARHQGQNGYTSAIGNDLFASFETTDSKSRLNFLHVLQGDEHTYAINALALAYCEQQQLPAALLETLKQGAPHVVGDDAWKAHLAGLSITSARHVRIATEGALLGGLIDRGVSPQLIVLSDGALQFSILVHAACWIHAERPLHKMVPHNEAHRAVIEKIRGQLWELYKDLKAYKEKPDEAQRPLLEACFDALVDQRTGYPNIDQALKTMRAMKADLLRVLERPEVPLHNNAMERDIREFVKRRKISGGTRSAAGRRCRDTFASLKKTCRKLGIRFWDYLKDRVAGLGTIPRLAAVIRHKAREAAAKEAAAVPV